MTYIHQSLRRIRTRGQRYSRQSRQLKGEKLTDNKMSLDDV